MIRKISLAALALTASLSGGNLTFESGRIIGHTEVFGDTTIDPTFKKATSHLTMDDTILSIRGTIDVSMSDFISDNKKRDEHMQEALESSSFPKAIFDIKEVIAKGGESYLLKGFMNLHGVTKPMTFEATITNDASKVHIKAASVLKMTDYGIKPIKLMFLTVRDQVDVLVDVTLKR